MTKAFLSEEVKQEWQPVIEAEGVAPIKDSHIRNVTTICLENTRKVLKEEVNTSNVTTGGGMGFDPILISMVRRTMPSLIANDIMGVQPMTGPTGLIFALKANYATGPNAGSEALGTAAADPAFSGPQATAAGEALGTGLTNDPVTNTVSQTNPWPEMGFTIDKISVTADTRALKAKYTEELATDLKAIHGLDAETELSNILSAEIVAEINREMINLVSSQAILVPSTRWGGAAANTWQLVADSDARWEVERYKSLYLQIVREANEIAIGTRRGVGNILIVSPNLASALASATTLDQAPISGSVVDNNFVGATYAGILGGRFKMYIDPYMTTETVIVGYKGANAYDAGLFYCPYVPLQFMRARGEEDFQPRIGVKTRYGLAANPFVADIAGGSNLAAANANPYYRRFDVDFAA